MNDEWEVTTVGELATWRGGMTPSMSNPAFWTGGEIPWLSSKEVVGGVLTGTTRKVTAEALRGNSLRLADAGSVAVVVRSGILLHTFPVAYVPFPTTVNQDVKIGTPSPGVNGRFLAYLLESEANAILGAYRKTGTTVQSINVPALLGHKVRVPSLPVQRRIVDLMGHLDTHLANLESERISLSHVLDGWLESWMDAHPQPGEPMQSLCRFRSGPSWAAKDEHRSPGAGLTPVVKITNTRPDGSMDLSAMAYVGLLPKSTVLLNERSLIVIRTNGNRERIGNAYIPPPGGHGSAVSAFQFLGDARSVQSRDYVYWFLRSPRMQRAMSDAASGTTGLGNLAAGWLHALRLPQANDADVNEFVTVARVLEDAQSVLRKESANLRTGRRTLLYDLLSRHVEITDDYDEFIGMAS